MCLSNLQSSATSSANVSQPLLPVIKLLPLPGFGLGVVQVRSFCKAGFWRELSALGEHQPILTRIRQVTRGRVYLWCNGTNATKEKPCEPGANSTDPNLPAGNQDTTASLVVCPRPDCLATNGCSPQVRPNISG